MIFVEIMLASTMNAVFVAFFALLTNAQAADLIIAVRTGHANGPTIRNSPADRRPNDQIGDIPDASQQGVLRKFPFGA